MATAKQRAAARRNIRKAQAALRGDIRRGKRKTTRRSRAKTRIRTVYRSARRRTSMPRRRMMARRSRSGLSGITGFFRRGIVSDAVRGIGGGAIAGIILDRTIPQYAPIGNLAGGFLAGGLWGGIINALVSGAVTGLSLAGVQSGGTSNGRNLAL